MVNVKAKIPRGEQMSCVKCRPWWRTFSLVKVLLGSLCTVMSISLLRHFWEYVWIRLYWRARLSIISSEYTVHYALWISKIIHGVQDLSSQMSAMLFSSVRLTSVTRSNAYLPSNQLQTPEKRSVHQQISSYQYSTTLISSSMLHHFIELELHKVNISLLT